MIVFTAGGHDFPMHVLGANIGRPIEEVVIDRDDIDALAKATDEQLRDWVDQLRANFIPPKRPH